MAAGDSTMALAGEVEALPRDVLQLLLADASRALLEDIVRCAADDLVREHVITQRDNAAADTRIEQLIPSWQALGQDVADLQKVYGAVCALLVQFARENAQGTAAQKQVLLELGLDDLAFVNALLPLLVAAAPPIRVVLEHSSFDFAHVVDVTWRLDYVLRTSTAGSVHEPLYYVQLKLQTPSGAIEHVAFACSVEELRDMVYRLQEATNEVEKLAAGLAAPTVVIAATAAAPSPAV